MKLIIQPGEGVDSLLKGIRKAKKSVEVVIFRFDRSEIERALVDAVERGVFVHALIAFTNRGGEKNLRKLETDFLAAGITVARTAGDLVRYHGKMMVIDRKELYLLAFNFTHLDIDHSRSFGLITRNPKLVQDAVRLFECDTKRQAYAANSSKLIVSPANARKELAAFIKGAKRELLIYDPQISDRNMLRLLHERERAGVAVRVLGEVSRGSLPVRALGRLRLHARTIIRDRRQAFLGSQSLRQLELDSRREIGVIFRDAKVIAALTRTFEEDWAAAEAPKAAPGRQLRAGEVAKTAKQIAKVVARKVPVDSVVKQVSKAIRRNGAEMADKEVEQTLKSAVKDTVKEAVKAAAKDTLRQSIEPVLQKEAS